MPVYDHPCHLGEHVPFASIGYYRIGGTVRYVATPCSVAELSAVLLWAAEKALPIALKGEASNILFSDEDFPGVVVSFEAMTGISRTGEHAYWCEAGVSNTALAERLLEDGCSGGEWLCGLPGTIGGTVRMNARCFGGEISSVAQGVLTVSLQGHVHWHQASEVFHGYKETLLMKEPLAVAGALLSFSGTGSRTLIESGMQSCLRERERRHHFDFPSCGSVFKNDYALGRSSGAVFEELGFKGALEGNAEVSAHHANFIFNRGGATASDVLRLAARMRHAAKKRTGTDLELEMACVGRFLRSELDACGISSIADDGNPSMAWAGLLRPPGPSAVAVSSRFPLTLLEGPIIGYDARDSIHVSGPIVRIEQLHGLDDALDDPSAPLLRWHVEKLHGIALRPVPPDLPRNAADGLWHYGVVELFIGTPYEDGRYMEFEMSPALHWLALSFEGPRVRSDGHELPCALPWEGQLAIERDNEGMAMSFSRELLAPLMRNDTLALQCAISSGEGHYGLFPGWAKAPMPPDFHHPRRFCSVRLSRSSGDR